MIKLSKKHQPVMNRRTFLKRGSLTAISFLAACAVPFYSYFAEPRWIETIKLQLNFPRLPKSFDGLRIVHFSDIHYGFFYDTTSLNKLIAKINALEPDIVVFTGDFFDAAFIPYVEECVEALTNLSAAPLGHYAVMGNHDYYSGYNRSTPVIEVYEAGGFKVLRNENIRIERDGESIQIAGIDDMLLGKPNLEQTFQQTDPNTFTLFLAHEPEYADRAMEFPIDLQLSGHSHGGQIRLPLLGAIITPPGGRKYVHGLHALNSQTHARMVYTTRGIGTSHIPIRFLCRPEITVLTLRSQNSL